jgi:hypothetical protein
MEIINKMTWQQSIDLWCEYFYKDGSEEGKIKLKFIVEEIVEAAQTEAFSNNERILQKILEKNNE